MKLNEVNIVNRRARFDYEISETFTAGIVLTGTEIKSIRLGKAGLSDTEKEGDSAAGQGRQGCRFHGGASEGVYQWQGACQDGGGDRTR